MSQEMLCWMSFILVLISLGDCQRPDVRGFCTSVLESPASSCDLAQCQGRDGKRGSQGIPGNAGIKGEKGDRGAGTEDLLRRLQNLEDKLKTNERATALDFCAMGMKSGKILDAHISTSSSSSTQARKQWSRLDQTPIPGSSIGSWCANSNDRSKWIKVDLGRETEVSGVVTQGSSSSSSWTKTFTISCGDERGNFRDITEFGTVKVFEGNYDGDSEVLNFFDKPISCRFIQINLKTWNRAPCLRLEILRGACSSPKLLSIYVESSGLDDGNNCKVLINGLDHAVKSRGHCVVILNPRTNEITANTYDTYGSDSMSSEMGRFITGAPEYAIIAIAVRDATISNRIRDDESDLLQNLGAVGIDCPTKPERRDSWAFLTQKVRPADPRPSWVKCQYVHHFKGKAAVQALIPRFARYDSLEDSPIG